jgi:hypothetical protein
MILQRLRGLIGTTIIACVPWTALGALTGLVFQLRLVPGMMVFSSYPIPGGLVGAFALAGAIVGITNGIVFSGLVLAAERGKTVDDLRPGRFATWGAVATAGTLGVLFSSPIAAGIGAVLGAAAAVATLATAQRARLTTTSSPSLKA